jgi:hypothetical protein
VTGILTSVETNWLENVDDVPSLVAVADIVAGLVVALAEVIFDVTELVGITRVVVERFDAVVSFELADDEVTAIAVDAGVVKEVPVIVDVDIYDLISTEVSS